jgi:hypothetical protein
MPIETKTAQLERVQRAIAAIEEGGQDVSYDGKRVTFADLQALYRREEKLRLDVARDARGGIRVRFGVP